LMVLASPPNRNNGITTTTAPDFLEGRKQCSSCAEIAAHTGAQPGNLSGGAEAERVRIASVSDNLFSALGVQPLFGRTFFPDEMRRPSATAGDMQSSGTTVAILSYALWQRRFGADPNVIGKTVKIEGDSCEVVGVMPREFRFPEDADAWIPVTLSTTRNNAYLRILIR
jgi:putative ABC transport system permease protein